MHNLLIIADDFPQEHVDALGESFNIQLTPYGDAVDIIKANDFDIIIYNSPESFSSLALGLASFQSQLKRSCYVFINYTHSKEDLMVRSYFFEVFSLETFNEKKNLLLAMKAL